MVRGGESRGRMSGSYDRKVTGIQSLLLISTPFHMPSLDALVFWAISASLELKLIVSGGYNL